MNRASQAFKLKVFAATFLVLLVGTFLVRSVRTLATTRQAVGTYARLIAAGNAGDLAAVRPLCSGRYLDSHALKVADGGGVVGFPRQVHPNYRAWVEGAEVRLCSGNRVGQVVRFVQEAGEWKYDGLVGVLRSDGRVEPMTDDPELDPEKP